MIKVFAIVVLIIPLTLFSQSIEGKIYDAESTVNGAKIFNLTQNLMVYSDEEGNFQIKANLNDQIAISTLFHEPQMIVLSQKDFDDVIVIELKKTVNELDDVYLNKIKEKEFEVSKTESQMKTQIKNDVVIRPELYTPPPNTNMDFIAIAGLIAKLFKKKKVEEPSTATYGELTHFFETDSFFNEQFLSSELKIDKDYHPLFVDFCEVKGIEQTLLLKENQLPLIDTLVVYGKEFSTLIEDYKKD